MLSNYLCASLVCLNCDRLWILIGQYGLGNYRINEGARGSFWPKNILSINSFFVMKFFIFFKKIFSLFISLPTHFSSSKLLSKIIQDLAIRIQIFLHQIAPLNILYISIPNLSKRKACFKVLSQAEQMNQMDFSWVGGNSES